MKIRTKLVGILNVTPDSFSDGGKFQKTDHALEHFHTLIENGAEMVDIGAQSTRPNAIIIGAEAEWKRLAPLLQAIALCDPDIAISIDTFHGSVAQRALKTGIVTCINDVSGGENLELLKSVAEYECDYICMHHLGIPPNKTQIIPLTDDPIDILSSWISQKQHMLQNHGIMPERTIFDIGLGFGKNNAQSVEILRRIGELAHLNVPLYVGHSEKSFLIAFTQKPAGERLAATLAVSSHLMRQQIAYIRVHDVTAHHTLKQALSAL